MAALSVSMVLAAAFRRLELCEDLLDRIEVRRVEREEHQCRFGPFDCRPGVRGLVGGEIVHDHDVAGVQRRREEGLGKAVKTSPFMAPSMTMGRSGRRGLVVFQWQTAAVAARGAPTQAGHLCGCASLVEEHQPCRIEIWLKGEPSLVLTSSRSCSQAWAVFF